MLVGDGDISELNDISRYDGMSNITMHGILHDVLF